MRSTRYPAPLPRAGSAAPTERCPAAGVAPRRSGVPRARPRRPQLQHRRGGPSTPPWPSLHHARQRQGRVTPRYRRASCVCPADNDANGEKRGGTGAGTNTRTSGRARARAERRGVLMLPSWRLSARHEKSGSGSGRGPGCGPGHDLRSAPGSGGSVESAHSPAAIPLVVAVNHLAQAA